MTPAWVEAAKGIPCWRGAMFFPPEQSTSRLCVDVTEPSSFRDEHNTWCSRSDHDSALCVPDLADPDTRAMYLRRLSVALGCPESTADIGVTFQASGDGYECAAGRKITMEGGTFTPWRWHSGGNPRFAVADERVALALAWPADKRVTG